MALYKRFLLVIAAIACAAGVICGVIIAKANTERRLYGEKQQREVMENDLPLSYSATAHQKMPYCRIRSDRASALESVSAVSFRENR